MRRLWRGASKTIPYKDKKVMKIITHKTYIRLYILCGILSPLFILIFSRVARYTPSSSDKNRLKVCSQTI